MLQSVCDQLFFFFLSVQQEFVLKKLLSKKKVVNVGKGELKLSLMITYYVILGVIGLVVFSEIHTLSSEQADYFICGGSGRLDCRLDLAVQNSLVITTNVLLSFFPAAVILTTCDLTVCKRKLRKTKTSNMQLQTQNRLAYVS